MAAGIASPGRSRDLDGLRGIAVLLVIFLHYVSRGGYFAFAEPATSLGAAPLALFLDSFWSGVDIFFVLSGFLIGGIILDDGRANNFLRVFYARRAFRILPVALLTIAFSYLVIPLMGPAILTRGQVPPYAYLLFVSNFWTAEGLEAYPPLGPMWSLAIEQQFYLIAPAFLLLVGGRTRNAILLVVILFSPGLRLWDSGLSPWDFTPFRLDGFAAGILLAAWIRDARCNEFAARNRRIINIVAIGAVLAAPAFSICPDVTLRERVALGISLNSLATAAVILFVHLNPLSPLSAVLSRPWLVTTGRLSYFLYLMHVPVLWYVVMTGAPRAIQPLLAFGICLLGAWASWRFLESKLIGLGKRLDYDLPGRSVAAFQPSRDGLGDSFTP